MLGITSDAALWAVPIAAIVISLSTLVVTAVMGSRGLVQAADAQRVARLENDLKAAVERIAECERDRTELRREVRRLESREINLMRRLTALEENNT
jgi:septal ring factor EnvC (AmiA/AmiB activator)